MCADCALLREQMSERLALSQHNVGSSLIDERLQFH